MKRVAPREPIIPNRFICLLFAYNPVSINDTGYFFALFSLNTPCDCLLFQRVINAQKFIESPSYPNFIINSTWRGETRNR